MRFAILALLLSSPAWATCTQATISDSFVLYLLGNQCLVSGGAAGSAQAQIDHTAAYDSTVQNNNNTYPSGTVWAPYQHLATGTVSVGVASTTVTRTAGSVDFRNACGGTSSPLPSANVIFKVPASVTSDGIDHYTYANIASCDSASQVTLSIAWVPGSPSVMPTSLTNVGYVLDWSGGTAPSSWSGQASIPTYDNVMAEYILHYRNSGDTAHLAIANSLADTYWNSPEIDQGYCHTELAGSSRCFPQRAINLQGMFMRATLGGAANMWPGLRILRDNDLIAFIPTSPYYVYDQRDYAYILLSLAAGCKGDPDSGERTTWCNAVVTMNTNAWAHIVTARSNFMASYFAGPSSFSTSSHVNVTNGNTLVTLVGATWSNDYHFGSVGTGPNIMFFDTPGTQPDDNTSDVWYCTYASTTTCNLTSVYTGLNSTNKGWTLLDNGTGHALAYGSQPFFMALMINAWEQAAAALDGVNNTIRDVYRGYADSGITYLLTYSMTPTLGAYYFTTTANCPAANTRSDCYNAAAPYESLAWGLEIPRAMAQNYSRTGNVSIPTFTVTLLDEQFAGWTGPVMGTCTGLLYIITYDENCIGFGGGDWVTAGNGLTGHKFYGQLKGINGWDWYAVTYTAPIVPARIGVSGRFSKSGR